MLVGVSDTVLVLLADFFRVRGKKRLLVSHGDLEAFYLDHSEMWKRSFGDQKRVSLEKAELRQDQQTQEESQGREDRHQRGEWRVAGMSVLLYTLLVSES